jgi:hypothetical protein
MRIYRELNDREKYLDLRLRDLDYGDDYCDLADFYWKHGEREKALEGEFPLVALNLPAPPCRKHMAGRMAASIIGRTRDQSVAIEDLFERSG